MRNEPRRQLRSFFLTHRHIYSYSTIVDSYPRKSLVEREAGMPVLVYGRRMKQIHLILTARNAYPIDTHSSRGKSHQLLPNWKELRYTIMLPVDESNSIQSTSKPVAPVSADEQHTRTHANEMQCETTLQLAQGMGKRRRERNGVANQMFMLIAVNVINSCK